MNQWMQSYRELLDYVRKHPGIRIDSAVTVIPDSCRQGFYQRFDRVRLAFLADYFHEVPEEIGNLKRALEQVQEALVARLHLSSITLGRLVSQFIQNPYQVLMRDLFDPLFNSLKTENDREIWENKAIAALKERYSHLLKSAYIRWIVLALTKGLQPSACYRVDVPRLEISAKGPVIPVAPQEVPHPKPSDEISFPKEAVPSFIVPQTIIYSTLAERYISFRADLDSALPITEVLWTASEYDQTRQWINLNGHRQPLGLQFCLIIQSHTSLEYAGLIADAERIARPQVILDFKGPNESIPILLDKSVHYRNYLDPVDGLFLVGLRGDKDCEPLEEHGARYISVGLDKDRLNPVIEALVCTQT